MFQSTINQLHRFFRTSTTDTIRQYFMTRMPNYAYAESIFKNLLTRLQFQQLHSPTPENTVTLDEMGTVMKTLRKEVVGTWNPFGILWRTLLSIMGNRRAERITTAANILKEYSQLNNAPQLVNDALKDLLKLMHKRISQLEGTLSKLGIKTNKAVLQDPTLKLLKEVFQSWIQVFSSLLSGAFPRVLLPESDIPFLRNLASQLTYGRHKEYLSDLAPPVEEIAKQAEKLMQRKNQQVSTAMPNASSAKNNYARNLAKANHPAMASV